MGKNRVEEAKADIDVQLKRRFDLIPNLIETVKGYKEYESDTFARITELRTKAMAGKDLKEVDEINKEISKELRGLFVNVEAYPELKANTNFLNLQEELADTENKIQASRRFYNNMVKEFNILTEILPSNLVATLLRYRKFEMLSIGDDERENIKVEF
ncbi:MAG: LemA family protein [Candidatus Pacebacteria bacterium]|nr:LemA family protein [Candidatus Paceibacterota bacterium]